MLPIARLSIAGICLRRQLGYGFAFGVAFRPAQYQMGSGNLNYCAFCAFVVGERSRDSNQTLVSSHLVRLSIPIAGVNSSSGIWTPLIYGTTSDPHLSFHGHPCPQTDQAGYMQRPHTSDSCLHTFSLGRIPSLCAIFPAILGFYPMSSFLVDGWFVSAW